MSVKLHKICEKYHCRINEARRVVKLFEITDVAERIRPPKWYELEWVEGESGYKTGRRITDEERKSHGLTQIHEWYQKSNPHNHLATWKNFELTLWGNYSLTGID